MITDYTEGKLMVTSWRWNEGAVTPGQSSGLCVGEPSDASAYWSCWEFYMNNDGVYDDMAKSYLINPSEFSTNSSLNQFEDISMKSFPGFYGSWICLPPITMGLVGSGTYTNCMRFLPSEEYSKDNNDYAFTEGPLNIMTYLTSRSNTTATAVNGNNNLINDGTSAFESFNVNLMGGLSGISAAGVALAAVVALASF